MAVLGAVAALTLVSAGAVLAQIIPPLPVPMYPLTEPKPPERAPFCPATDTFFTQEVIDGASECRCGDIPELLKHYRAGAGVAGMLDELGGRLRAQEVSGELNIKQSRAKYDTGEAGAYVATNASTSGHAEQPTTLAWTEGDGCWSCIPKRNLAMCRGLLAAAYSHEVVHQKSCKARDIAEKSVAGSAAAWEERDSYLASQRGLLEAIALAMEGATIVYDYSFETRAIATSGFGEIVLVDAVIEDDETITFRGIGPRTDSYRDVVFGCKQQTPAFSQNGRWDVNVDVELNQITVLDDAPTPISVQTGRPCTTLPAAGAMQTGIMMAIEEGAKDPNGRIGPGMKRTATLRLCHR